MELTEAEVKAIRDLNDLVGSLTYARWCSSDVGDLAAAFAAVERIGLSRKRRLTLFAKIGERAALPAWATRVGPYVPPAPEPAPEPEPDVPWDPDSKLKVQPSALRRRFAPSIDSFDLGIGGWSW